MKLKIIRQVNPNIVAMRRLDKDRYFDINNNEIDFDVNAFLLNEVGETYEYYLPELVNGKYMPDTVKLQEIADAEAKAQSKINRQVAVDALVITITNGKKFNGDKSSIADLKNALDTAREYAEMYPTADPLTETSWKLYDDTVATVTFTEIQEAYIRGNLQYQQTFISFG